MSNTQTVREGIDFSETRRWSNRHQTVSQQLSGIFDIYNIDNDDKLSAYNAATENFKWLIGEAKSKGIRLHALGGGWSLTDVGMSRDYLVNTKQLRLIFSISKDRVVASYPGKAKGLRLIQCGNSITRLNRKLRESKRSIKTSGSSNGQTIAGALSTGTHGSAFKFGAIQEFVVGIHLVVGTSRHVWLERKSYPVTKPNFAKILGAELIRDDQLFNAALVSFGSFGFIHSVMIETDPLFLLEAHRVLLPFNNSFRKCLSTLDFSSLNLPHPHNNDNQLIHFEVVFNPNGDLKDAIVTVMYKRTFRKNYPHLEAETDEPGLGDGALSIIGRILDQLPARLTRPSINRSVASEFAEYGPKWGTVGEIFSSEKVRGKTLSAAMAIPLSEAENALEIALSTHSNHGELFPGIISLRYVKGSEATLAFTRFPQSKRIAVLEVDSIYSKENLNFLKKVWKQLDQSNIPYKVHWGKINNITKSRVNKMYGNNAIEQWTTARESLLEPATRNIFTNPFLEKAGLAT